MKYWVSIILLVIVFACKKAEDRRCTKSFGEITEQIYPLDSVQEFKLYKGMKFRFFQDTLKQIVVRGGQNLQNFISISNDHYITTIENKNTCNFLRKKDNIMEVDIHYPHFHKIYAEPSDSMIFMDTLRGDYTNIHLRNGGGTLKLNVNMTQISVGISFGVGNFIIGGQAEKSSLSIQNSAYGDALNLQSKDLFIYQNSSNDILTNFDSATVKVAMYASGDILYKGTASSIVVDSVGDGQILKY